MKYNLFSKGLRFFGWAVLLLLLPIMLALALLQIKMGKVGWQRR